MLIMPLRTAPETHACESGDDGGDSSGNCADYCDEGSAVFLIIIIVVVTGVRRWG
jgi:hypothetical protein